MGEKRFWDIISNSYDKVISAEIDEGCKVLLGRIVNDRVLRLYDGTIREERLK